MSKPTRRDKRMHFLAFMQHGVINHAIGTWALPEDKPGYDYARPRYWQDIAKVLENGLFDAIFLADELAPYNVYRGSVETTIRYAVQCPVHDPATLVPIIGLATQYLGVGLTQSATFEHPYTLCRRLSTLDHLTNGRIGWNMVTSYSSSEFQALGFSDVMPRSERYARMEEFVAVCKALWGSWSEDAIIADRESAVYADPEKVRVIAHEGRYFRCHAPAFVRRSPQGMPVLWQAGASPEGRAFASRHAEAVFSIQPDADRMRSYADDIRRLAVENGRDADDLRIFFGIQIFVDKTRDGARARYDELRRLIPVEAALAKLCGDIGFDFSELDLDEPLRNIEVPGIRGLFEGILARNPGNPPTVREAATLYGLSLGAPILVGTPRDVADQLESLFEQSGGDGFMLLATDTPGCFERFVRSVVPLLQKRGLYRTAYPAKILRENILAPS